MEDAEVDKKSVTDRVTERVVVAHSVSSIDSWIVTGLFTIGFHVCVVLIALIIFDRLKRVIEA